MEEPEKKGLLGSVGTFIKNVVGTKSEEAGEEPIVAESPDSPEIAPEVEGPEVVVELPPFAEIEAYLFAQPEFQADASWLEQLSQKRSANVKAYLVATKGIDASRVFISGKASEEESEEKSKPVSAVKFELTD